MYDICEKGDEKIGEIKKIGFISFFVLEVDFVIPMGFGQINAS